MHITKIFQCGNSRAIRLPKNFLFNVKTVEIFEQNGDLIVRPIPTKLSKAFELLASLPNDFFADERLDSLPQERDSL